MNICELAKYALRAEELVHEVDGLARRITEGGHMADETVVKAEELEIAQPRSQAAVHLDFRPPAGDNPFLPAERAEKRLKCFIWGESGSGKTTLALQFPKPAVIDLEGGSDHHAERFQFSRLSTSNAEDAIHSVDWLLTNPHDYRTLVIDPVTVLWDSIQRKWSDIFLKRNKGKKGYKFEFYSLDFKDWATIKGEWKDILRKLTALDMSVVVTARAKTMFEEEGEGRKRQGTEVFDGEKSLPYLFDVILQTFRDGTKYMLRTVKDRTGKLPSGEWESNIEVFTECLGRRVLTKAATPLKIATPAQREAILRLAAQAGMSDAQVQDRILLYGADTLEDLTKVNAQTIIEKLETYLTTTKGRTA